MEKVRGYGSFLAEWWYVGAGPGDHAAGDYFLHVTPGFLGCLQVFESGRRKLSSGREITAYDFGRKPTADLVGAPLLSRKQAAKDAGMSPDQRYQASGSASKASSSGEGEAHSKRGGNSPSCNVVMYMRLC